MADSINPVSIFAPGYFGLNTQDSPVGMDKSYALEATNCVIDRFGRVGARNGWVKAHSLEALTGTADVQCIGELVSTAGVSTILCAVNNELFKLSGTTLVNLTYGGVGAAPTITDDNWQFVSFNGAAIFFQSAHDPLFYDPAQSTTEFFRVSDHPSYVGTVPLANTSISAYGRVWAANTTTTTTTVYWTDVLSYMVWSTGTAGSLDLSKVWVNGMDEVVGLAAHNGRLIIFGRTQILIYSGAEDPTTMKLEDAISNVGCIARDTIQNIGSDVLFLSNGGLVAISRVIQEKSAPIKTISRNVNSDIISYVAQDPAPTKIRGGYSHRNQMYLLALNNSKLTFCFDTKTFLPDGSARASLWTGIAPKAFCSASTGRLYLGQQSYIGYYSGYLDDTSRYTMTYFSPWIDFGNPYQISILKKIIFILNGSLNQTIGFKWGFDYNSNLRSSGVDTSGFTDPDEYNIDEYSNAEYSAGLYTGTVGLNASGAGRVVQVGIAVQIDGFPISIQQVDILAKDGRI